MSVLVIYFWPYNAGYSEYPYLLCGNFHKFENLLFMRNLRFDVKWDSGCNHISILCQVSNKYKAMTALYDFAKEHSKCVGDNTIGAKCCAASWSQLSGRTDWKELVLYGFSLCNILFFEIAENHIFYSEMQGFVGKWV